MGKHYNTTTSKGYPIRWPKLLLRCQSVLNAAVHRTTGVSPYYAYFSRPPPHRLISSDLLDTEASEEGIREAHEIIKEIHQKMARR